MIYEYDDKFLTAGIDETEIENIEAEKYNFVLNKLNINDNYYLEKLTKSLVYMQLAKMQLEADGMKAKYDIYKAEYEHFLNLARNSVGGMFNVLLGRG
jgi:hypothetical protein